MTPRTVKALLFAHEYPMGKLRVKQPFPTAKVDYPDPFLLLHHARVTISPDKDLKTEGVGPHPHRGFSPVTFIFEGGVHHRDSRGNNSIIYKNGVQWMNAGRGIVHSERPPEDILERGGVQEIIQLWVNSPASDKMNQPQYLPLAAENTPTWKSATGRSEVRVVAGTLLGLTGPLATPIPLQAASMDIAEGETIRLETPSENEAFIYLLNGQIRLNAFGLVDEEHAVLFKMDGEYIEFTANQDSRLLFMSGKPIKEPMVSHGPFVMNTQTELLEAMRDYQMGKMGILIEE
jgi:redox-sensitive bicupin YhaK (pirin superfamily)